MLANVQADIIRAARENGLDPSLALAIADRESSGNVNGRAPGSTAFGLFQMLKSERAAYGGSSSNSYEQATAWARYIQGTKAEMAKRLGRDPTGPELYLGHFVGGTRAARMVAGQIPGQAPVSALFSPQELAVNPNIRGTTGAFTSSVLGDIARRQKKYAGAGIEPDAGNSTDFDPAQWGTPAGAMEAPVATKPVSPAAPAGGAVGAAVSPPDDLEKFGSPVAAAQSAPRPPPFRPPPTSMAQTSAIPFIPEQSIV